MNHTQIDQKLNPLISERWSPRAFDGSSVSEEQLNSLFEAGRRAASSYNIQPWRFIYARKEDENEYQKLFDSLMEPNQTWAHTAPVLMATIARIHDNNGNPNPYAWHDVGLAMGNLINQAMHQGLYIHQMGGYYAEKARANLEIPDGFEPVAMAAIGYPGSTDQLPENLQAFEKEESPRKPLTEIVFKGKWGRAFSKDNNNLN